MRELKFVDGGAKHAFADLVSLISARPWAGDVIEKAGKHGMSLITAKPEGFVAPGTTDVLMRLYPSDSLLELIAAIRAGERDVDVFFSGP